ncbi:hypothetical protein EAI_00693 [Harpegnathos saltator]|uniref:Uncharacterized protein n=1 Tax=Harpegnathos saltator TaxID=610380 RepID=E2BT42_HARSA|nr:hypothetical protein EAI_00693 [Harpegnathos saltator]
MCVRSRMRLNVNNTHNVEVASSFSVRQSKVEYQSVKSATVKQTGLLMLNEECQVPANSVRCRYDNIL